LDLPRQICLEVGSPAGSSLAVLTKMVRELLIDIRQKKQNPLLLTDEAQLLHLEVIAQLHTPTQFHFDSQSLMPIVLCGQKRVPDKLLFHTSRPFASRVVGRSHLEALKLKDIQS
jgi:general secretion pathway protein A